MYDFVPLMTPKAVMSPSGAAVAVAAKHTCPRCSPIYSGWQYEPFPT